MHLPMFGPSDNPGPSFFELLRRTGDLAAPVPGGDHIPVPHATTCVALRYADGVLVAGDRRATMGNRISHRGMEKVVQTDTHSAVAISGAASAATEMIKIFSLELEHYEKMEGRQLTLEGKANQLSNMVRANLPAAMQGLGIVMPLFAGFDLQRNEGRLWDYDAAGGRYEEREYVAIGSGTDYAGTVVKVGWRSTLTSDEAVKLACRALWEAADADSATGGPDALRGVYPIVATIDVNGWTRIGDEVLADVFGAINEEVRSR